MKDLIGFNYVGEASHDFGELHINWKWLVALGAVFVLLGTIGLGITYFITVASVFFLGFLLLIGGGAQVVHLFRSKGWKSVLLHLFIAVLYIIAGICIVSNPVAASITLTLVFAWILIIIGIFRIFIAFQARQYKNWYWLLLGGFVSVLFGLVIINDWPASGLFVIGLIIAIEMIIHGIGLIFFGYGIKHHST